MTKKISNWFIQNHVALLAITAFIILGSMNKPKPVSNIQANQVGYSVMGADLRKFMIDSLITRRYEGGLFKRTDLIAALNSMLSDSVYILNGLFACNPAKGTGLAITSPRDTSFAFVGWYPSAQEPYSSGYCKPCPQRACCPKKFCVINTDRFAVFYRPFLPGAAMQNNTETKVSTTESAEQ